MQTINYTSSCIAAALVISVSGASAQNKTRASTADHSSYIMNQKIWEMPLVDFQKKLAPLRFQWLTAEKQGLRSAGGASLFGVKSGETLVKGSKDKKVAALTFSVYNRGDHGKISLQDLNNRFNSIKSALTKAIGKEPENRTKKGAVNLTSYMWRHGATAFLLEKSTSNSRTAEFLRMRMAPLKDATRGSKTASRTGLRSNLKREKNGDTWITNVPMVDQGRKGYCACASAARIYQYYGRETDQHEMAQIAGSTAQGTSMSAMVSALKKVTAKLDSRVLVLYEYPKGMAKEGMRGAEWKSSMREISSDFNKYQTLAKQKNRGMINYHGKKGGKAKSSDQLNIFELQKLMDAEIYREVMVKKANFSRFQSQLKKYINEGIPVGWCLQLGMFPEPGLPQAGGGHMRLIIGYNDKTKEIIYSDSWGKGHERKKMPIANAYCMTNILLALPPTN